MFCDDKMVLKTVSEFSVIDASFEKSHVLWVFLCFSTSHEKVCTVGSIKCNKSRAMLCVSFYSKAKEKNVENTYFSEIDVGM